MNARTKRRCVPTPPCQRARPSNSERARSTHRAAKMHTRRVGMWLLLSAGGPHWGGSLAPHLGGREDIPARGLWCSTGELSLHPSIAQALRLGLDTLGTSALATETKRKSRGVKVNAIPPTEHASTGGGGHLGEGGHNVGGLPTSVAESCAATWAAQVDPQQQQISCSGAASTAAVNPLRGPMPSEQGGGCGVLPDSDLDDLGEMWRQLPWEEMLHCFSGRPRLGSLAHAAEQLRVKVDQIDLMQGGSECNMALHESREAMLVAVRAKRYSIVWIGTPCSSFSLWWLDKVYAPVAQ